MPEVIKARCPGCERDLHIPAEWLKQTFRCKHCRTVIHARSKDTPAKTVIGEPQPNPNPTSAASAPDRESSKEPAHTASASSAHAAEVEQELDFPALDAGPIVSVSSRYRRSRRSRWIALGIILLLLGIGGGAASYFWTHLRQLGASLRAALDEDSSKRGPSAANDKPPPAREVFPRRVLAICVHNYLYANPVAYGTEDNSVGALLDRLGSALHIEPSQIVELSDAAVPRQTSPSASKRSSRARARKPRPVPAAQSPARPPLRPVIERTISEFLDGCRPQDRILLLFAGHVVEIDGEGFLVPLEGEFSVKESLVPLSWLFERLQKCAARQKVLVLDTCRLDPGHGLERPGSGPMAEKLEALLAKPPQGVEVWTACAKGQYSYEFDGGSFFLKQIVDALDPKSLKKPDHVDEPLPIAALADVVNKKTGAEIAAQLKEKQTPRLTGKEVSGDVAFDKTQPLAAGMMIPRPSPPGGMAKADEVRSILEEIDLPPIKPAREESRRPLIEELVPFSAKKLEAYRADYTSVKEIDSNADRFPLRVAVRKAIKLIRDRFDPQNGGVALRENFSGNTNDRVKAEILKEQARPAELLLELQLGKRALEKAGEKREEELSPRWQAHYDYVLAQLGARIAFLEEYSLMLGKIRKNELPELEEGQTGFRLASREKLQGAKEFKDLAAEAKKILKKLAKDHKGTPWEILAKRDQLTALGLQWQATR